MELYLQDDVAQRNFDASPLSAVDEPYVGYDRRSPGAGYIITSIILVVAAAFGGWFAKGWFSKDEFEAANTASQESYWNGYNLGFDDGLVAFAEQNSSIPDPDATSNNASEPIDVVYPPVEAVFCGVFMDPNTDQPYIVLGVEPYWLDVSQSTSFMSVGTAYDFQIDPIANTVVGVSEEGYVPSANAVLCQGNS